MLTILRSANYIYFFSILGGKLLDKLFPVESLLSLFFCETVNLMIDNCFTLMKNTKNPIIENNCKFLLHLDTYLCSEWSAHFRKLLIN